MSVVYEISESQLRVFDRVVLFSWNQFSLKKIWFLRLSALGWAVCSFVEMNDVTARFVMLLMISFLLLGCELTSKWDPKYHNSAANRVRNNKWLNWLRAATIIYAVFHCLLTYGTDNWWFKIVGWISFYCYSSFDLAYIPEQPPKRRKFKLKLPKFDLGPQPVPQGI